MRLPIRISVSVTPCSRTCLEIALNDVRATRIARSVRPNVLIAVPVTCRETCRARDTSAALGFRLDLDQASQQDRFDCRKVPSRERAVHPQQKSTVNDRYRSKPEVTSIAKLGAGMRGASAIALALWRVI